MELKGLYEKLKLQSSVMSKGERSYIEKEWEAEALKRQVRCVFVCVWGWGHYFMQRRPGMYLCAGGGVREAGVILCIWYQVPRKQNRICYPRLTKISYQKFQLIRIEYLTFFDRQILGELLTNFFWCTQIKFAGFCFHCGTDDFYRWLLQVNLTLIDRWRSWFRRGLCWGERAKELSHSGK